MKQLEFVMTLNHAVRSLEVNELETALNAEPTSVELVYKNISTIDREVWMAKIICLGKLVIQAMNKGLKRPKAVADVSEVVGESKLKVKRAADIYEKIIQQKIAASSQYPLEDQAYYEIAVKYADELSKTPMELMVFMEDKFFELGKYSPAQAKIDLGLMTPKDPIETMLGHINSIAECDSKLTDQLQVKVNGDPNLEGTTERAAEVLRDLLSEDGLESQISHVAV